MGSDRSGPVLGDIVRLVRGTTYRSVLLGQPGPVLLGLSTIHRNGGFRSDSLKTYGGESKPKLLLRPGDLYVSLKDVTQSANLLGAVARVPSNIEVGRLTQDTVKLDFTGEAYPRALVYWTLRAPQYRAYCRACATGTTNLGLPREDFLAYELPAPTTAALSLVATFEAIEERIDNLRATNATLEAIAQALFKSWFVDFDPVHAKAEGRAPAGMDAATAAQFPSAFEDSELGPIPKGWVRGQVASFANIVSGKRPQLRTALPEKGVQIPLYGGGGVMGYTNESLFNEPVILTGRVGTLGKIFRVATPCWPSDNALVVRPQKVQYLEFAFFAMHLFDFSALNRGSTQPLVTQTDLKKESVTLPPERLINQFHAITRALFGRIDYGETNIATLVNLRDTLLPRLISGRLRLPNAVLAGVAGTP